jgi:hypothetical protein
MQMGGTTMHADFSNKHVALLLGQGRQVLDLIVIGGTQRTPHGKTLRGASCTFRGCRNVGRSGGDGGLKDSNASREDLDLACQWAGTLMDTASGSRASVAAIGSICATRHRHSNFQVLRGCGRIVVGRHEYSARHECRETAFVGLVKLWGTGAQQRTRLLKGNAACGLEHSLSRLLSRAE